MGVVRVMNVHRMKMAENSTMCNLEHDNPSKLELRYTEGSTGPAIVAWKELKAMHCLRVRDLARRWYVQLWLKLQKV